MRIFKKATIFFIAIICFDLFVMSCQKQTKIELCHTIITGITLENVSIEPNTLYPTGIFSLGGETIDRSKYALQINFLDSVQHCEITKNYNGILIGSAMAGGQDINIRATTDDRIEKLWIVSNTNYNDTIHAGDTINTQVNLSVYLLEHRYDNLNLNDFIPAYNALLSSGTINRYNASDYIPKVYLRMMQAASNGGTASFNIILQLANGRYVSQTSKAVTLSN
jgi:hypothetical protein